MLNPFKKAHDYWLRHKTSAAGADRARRGGTPDPDEYLASLGFGIPDRLRVDPQRAQAELLMAEQTVTTLKLQVTTSGRTLAKQPNKLGRRILTGALYVLESGSLTYLFVPELGYPLSTGLPMALLYTTGTFALTKSLYVNLQKPRHERAWYTPHLFVLFLVGAASLIVLRLASRTATDTNLAGTIAASLVLAFVTLLPGWLAARYELDLHTIHELQSEYESLTLEYREEQLRVAGLRQGIDASTPEDLRLIDQREQLKAVFGNAFKRAAGNNTNGATPL